MMRGALGSLLASPPKASAEEPRLRGAEAAGGGAAGLGARFTFELDRLDREIERYEKLLEDETVSPADRKEKLMRKLHVLEGRREDILAGSHDTGGAAVAGPSTPGEQSPGATPVRRHFRPPSCLDGLTSPSAMALTPSLSSGVGGSERVRGPSPTPTPPLSSSSPGVADDFRRGRHAPAPTSALKASGSLSNGKRQFMAAGAITPAVNPAVNDRKRARESLLQKIKYTECGGRGVEGENDRAPTEADVAVVTPRGRSASPSVSQPSASVGTDEPAGNRWTSPLGRESAPGRGARRASKPGATAELPMELESSSEDEGPEGSGRASSLAAGPSGRGTGVPRTEMRRSLRALGQNPYAGLVVNQQGVEVRGEDLVRLEKAEFLNDTLIDFYLGNLSEEFSGDDGGQARVMFYNSFFYAKLSQDVQKNSQGNVSARSLLMQRRHNQLRAWGGANKAEDGVFSYDFLLIPVNATLHWSLAIICFPGRLLKYARAYREAQRAVDVRDDEDIPFLFMDPGQVEAWKVDNVRFPQTFLLHLDSSTGMHLTPPLASKLKVFLHNELKCRLALDRQDREYAAAAALGAAASPIGPSLQDGDGTWAATAAGLATPGVMERGKRSGGSHSDPSGGATRSAVPSGRASPVQRDKMPDWVFDKLPKAVSLTVNHRIEMARPSVPQQDNHCDCGLFMLHFAKRFAAEAPCGDGIEVEDLLAALGGGRGAKKWFRAGEASRTRGVMHEWLVTLFNEEHCGVVKQPAAEEPQVATPKTCLDLFQRPRSTIKDLYNRARHAVTDSFSPKRGKAAVGAVDARFGDEIEGCKDRRKVVVDMDEDGDDDDHSDGGCFGNDDNDEDLGVVEVAILPEGVHHEGVADPVILGESILLDRQVLRRRADIAHRRKFEALFEARGLTLRNDDEMLRAA